MMNMEYRIVADGDVEETPPFPLSWGEDPAELAASLARAGQVSPLVLWPRDGRLFLLCGLRRRWALRTLGQKEFSALVLPENLDEKTALTLAVEDNRRPFNDAEKTLALRHLAAHFPEKEIVQHWLPRLDLPPRPEFFHRFRKLDELGPEGLDALAGGRLDPESGERLAQWPVEDRRAALDLLAELNPGRNKRREILVWLEEIARREDADITRVIGHDEIKSVLGSPLLARPQKEERVRAFLKSRRYPEWTGMMEKRARLIVRLNLPPDLRLETDPAFEGLEMKMTLNFANLDQFRKASETIRRLADDPALAELVDLG